jgi:hypothetical protein
LELLDSITQKARESLDTANLIPDPPLIHFTVTDDNCSCGGAIKVLKTKTQRLAHTLHVGSFIAHETQKRCTSCLKTYRSSEIERLLPSKCNFGYDVIVDVGKRLFLENRTLAEVKADLGKERIKISENGVNYLGRKFIAYLSLAHCQASERIKDVMSLNHGYMLHIDATCDGGSPMLLTGIDSITSIVLWNSKIPTEKSENIVPFLNEIKKMYGDPLLVVSDMGKGIAGAIREVFGDKMRVLICHFHFLRDIGKDFLGNDYDIIRSRLRKYGISEKLRYRLRMLSKDPKQDFDLIKKLESDTDYESRLTQEDTQRLPLLSACYLIHWALAGKGTGDACGFPFDRPHLVFVKRLKEVSLELNTLKDVFKNDHYSHPGILKKISKDLQGIIEDDDLWNAVDRLEEKVIIFDSLRDAMRIVPAGDKKGLNDQGCDVSMKKIESDVKKFRALQLKNTKMKDCVEHRKMLEQLNKYWDKLFADPIEIVTPEGIVYITPQRTNNLLEQFFRGIRRDHRRKSGNDAMAKKLSGMSANTPLIKNLKNNQYLHLILGECSSLEELFSKIDKEEVLEQMSKEKKGKEKIPAKVRKTLKSETFSKKLLKFVSSVME